MRDDSDHKIIIPIATKNQQNFEQFPSIYSDLSSSRIKTDNNDTNDLDTYDLIRI